ncbi:MAG TPA: hypothetical protein VIK77_02780 [Tissierellaceae bacterium]
MGRRSDYDIWYDKYQPINRDEDNFLYETYGEDLEYIKRQEDKFVWTLIDSDNGLYLSPGIHLVNRLAYIVCKNPFDYGNVRDYKY